MKSVNKEKLTAYALGELSPTERAEIEEIVNSSPELQKEVEEIQNFGSFLSEELKAEDLPKISEENRGKIFDEVIEKESKSSWWMDLIQGRMFPVGVVMTAFLGVIVFFSIQQEMLQQEAAKFDQQPQGLETSLALKDEANRAQLIGESKEMIAANGATIPAPSAKAVSLKGNVQDLALEEADVVEAETTSYSGFSPDRNAIGAKDLEHQRKFKAKPAKLAARQRSVKTTHKKGGAAKSPKASSRTGIFNALGSGSGKKGESYGRGRLVKKKSKIKPLPGSGTMGMEPQETSAWIDSKPRRENRGGDKYAEIVENPFTSVNSVPLSTFSIDVDTASYTNARRYLKNSNMLPPSNSVRIEEMVNYFSYNDPAPKGTDPFSVNLEMADSPWSDGHKLVRIGIKGKVFPKKNVKTNLVFLVDVSGSMDTHDKIGLLKEGLHKLVEQLGEDDHVSLVTYAGHSAVVLDSTSANQKKKIHKAIDDLTASGSTHGSEGIKTAYELAQKNFRKEGVNRVILASDGDFNVGTTSDQSLIDLVKEKAKNGVYLTVLGFGTGNLNDSMMEKISNNGNGNYYYIDSEKEAKKVLVDRLQGTLVTIAKDVKIQVEFNPSNVSEYRLIGYENRQLAAKDFNDDKKDAGEIGAGHSVVALYEIKPAGFEQEGVDPLKYQQAKKKEAKKKAEFSGELLTVKLRYKKPNENTSKLIKFPLKKASRSFASASPDFRWTASVAGFGMMLKGSKHKGSLTYEKLLKFAEEARWANKTYDAERSELVELIKKAKKLTGQ